MIDDIAVAIIAGAPALLYVSSARSGKKSSSNRASWGLAICFIYFSLGHFIFKEKLVEMLPLFVPFRPLVILLTGILELLIAAALFIPSFQRFGAVIAIIVLIMFLPANIYACVNHVGIGEHKIGPIYLVVRIPLQIWLIMVALAIVRLRSPKPPSVAATS